jgi:SAM-dependent methyltransferase
MSGNAQQIEYWNGPVGEKWARLQQTIDTNMAAITAALMSFAAPQPGERVIDIGCGGGTTTALLAKAVGPSGDVTGVDISRPMLTLARSRGIAANFLEADASAHAFKPTHDLVFSRFGVMFFAEPALAFANIRKALKPGGRVAFVCWRPFVENAWSFAPYSAAKSLLPEEPPGDPHAPGPFAFADDVRLAAILGDAGFDDVSIDKLDTTMNMGANAGEASAQAMNIGPLARAATGLDDVTRGRIKLTAESVLEKYKTAKGIEAPAACWLVRAAN